MSIFQFPFFRTVYPGIDNPLYVSDVLVCQQAILDGLSAILDLPNPGFAIVSGFKYTTGSPGSYAPGIVWLNGTFYAVTGTTTEGLYLQGSTIQTLSEGFDDGNSRTIYTLQQAISSINNTGAGPYSPLLSGAMTSYRIGSYDILTALQAAQATIGLLKGAAFMEVGTTAGTVAAGNDSRFGFTQAAADARYAQISQVLIEGQTNNNFNPTQPYDPATKKYVDTSAGQLLAKGTNAIGDGWSGSGAGFTVEISPALTSASYSVDIEVISNSSNPANDVIYAPFTRNKTNSSFDVYLRKSGSATANLSINWKAWAL